MAGIYGALGLNAADSMYAFVNVFGQKAIYDAVNQTLDEFTADLDAAMSVWVEDTTDAHIERYLLPGGGRLQRMGESSQAGAVKASGSWDVAYPLEEFGAKLAHNRVAFAYMTLNDLDRHMKTIEQQNVNTFRYEMLKALFNSGTRTFLDREWGNLTIQPLANGDAVTYPPVLGSETDATANNYLIAGYQASSISDTNDPFPTLVNTLEQHFGTPTGGSQIVVFINNAQTVAVGLLKEFTTITNIHIHPGQDVNTVLGLGGEERLPGRVLGVHQQSGALIVEWRFVPAGYMLAVHMLAPKPLKKRVDPATTGLPQGLRLIAQSDVYPFTESNYSHRFGLGVGNRLNGVAMQLAPVATTSGGTTSSGSTSITVTALSDGIPSGTWLNFGGVLVQLTAAAAAAATSLAVAATSASIPTATASTYATPASFQ